VEGLHIVGVHLINYKCKLCIKSCVVVIIMHFLSWFYVFYAACIFCYHYVYNYALQSVFLMLN
jgi:hypothetical protein